MYYFWQVLVLNGWPYYSKYELRALWAARMAAPVCFESMRTHAVLFRL
jgi:hypothetical protein